jgi:hypothetical protein
VRPSGNLLETGVVLAGEDCSIRRTADLTRPKGVAGTEVGAAGTRGCRAGTVRMGSNVRPEGKNGRRLETRWCVRVDFERGILGSAFSLSAITVSSASASVSDSCTSSRCLKLGRDWCNGSVLRTDLRGVWLGCRARSKVASPWSEYARWCLELLGVRCVRRLVRGARHCSMSSSKSVSSSSRNERGVVCVTPTEGGERSTG